MRLLQEVHTPSFFIDHLKLLGLWDSPFTCQNDILRAFTSFAGIVIVKDTELAPVV